MNTTTPASIIIPTLNEADNIPILIKRISSLDFGNRVFEVILVDDNSMDNPITIVNQLRVQYPWLRLITRQGLKGLSRAVIDGFEQAQYPLCIIMDADLSHQPEIIPDLLAQLSQPGIEMVIGSRYVAGGRIDANWPLSRKWISRLSAWLARTCLALPIKDPLSGFIAIKKDIYKRAAIINPIGWKIGLEIMVRCDCRHIVEIPISFTNRNAGKSKLTMRVGFQYLKQLVSLFFYQLRKAS